MPAKLKRPTKEILLAANDELGNSYEKMAKLFGVSRGTIGGWLRHYEIKTKGKNIPPLDVVKKMYIDDLMTMDEIAKAYNVSIQNISLILIKNNIATRKRCNFFSDFSADLAKNVYLEKKLTVKRIASLYGVAEHHVRKKLYDFGLAIPDETPKWQQGYIGKNGYRVIRIDGKPKYEHRVVVERNIGRKLKRSEHVHHINEDKLDNRIENLVVMGASEHLLEMNHRIKKWQDLKSDVRRYRLLYEEEKRKCQRLLKKISEMEDYLTVAVVEN